MDAGSSDVSDAELVALARLGNKDAFGHLADRYTPLARRLARRMVAPDGLADDVVQEALLQAYLSLRHPREPDRFRSWFYGIVLNVCRGELRAFDNDAATFADLAGGASIGSILADGESSPHALAEQREATAVVLHAIEALPLKDRQATLLFYFEALSVREVAEVLCITEGAVRVHLYNARTALREQLTPDSTDRQTQPTLRTSKQRRKGMVTVSIADVIETRTSKYRVVVLLDASSQRVLPIWVGEPEAGILILTLRNVSTPRPMTSELTANLLKASGVTVERVHIAALKSETFYATVTLRAGGKTSEVDARPSDALALAVLMNASVAVDDAILAGHGVEMSDAQIATLGRGLDAQSAKLASEMFAWVQPPPADDAELTYREVQALLTKH